MKRILPFVLVVLSLAHVAEAEYRVGVNYHATTTDFVNSAFLSQYDQPAVRATVLGQLQDMANGGASVVKTTLWQVGGTVSEPWRLAFPLSLSNLTNLATYAHDVAGIQRPDGSYLSLEVALAWLGCADYTQEQGAGKSWTYGACAYSWSTLTSKAKTSAESVLSALDHIRHPDGTLVVSRVYLEIEVMVGAKANQAQFLADVYPYFLSRASSHGLTGSLYFLVVPDEASILDDGYVDAQYPVLNGHRSLYWVYRSTAWMTSHKLPVPARIDVSFYPVPVQTDYPTLVHRVLVDTAAVYPNRPVAVVETYTFVNAGQRWSLGQAFADAYLGSGEPVEVDFWPTPYTDGTVPSAPPFDWSTWEIH